ncbi:MAG: Disulfide bond formation protein D [Chlamydiia bacterium]|nr:Disulfide bond formation protein D [Chlamydiia bacterium]
MKKNLLIDRFLLIITAIILVGVFATAAWTAEGSRGSKKSINVRGQPTFGSPTATVQVIVFEEFLCHECRYYQHEVFPKLKENYLDTGKIQYIFIPLAYHQGSKNPFLAAWCINKYYPELYFDFLDFLSTYSIGDLAKKTTMELLMHFNQHHPHTNLTKLRNCVVSKRPNKQIALNLEIASDAMDDDVAVPAVFVNGEKLPNHRYKEVSEAIDRALEKQGGQ